MILALALTEIYKDFFSYSSYISAASSVMQSPSSIILSLASRAVASLSGRVSKKRMLDVPAYKSNKEVK